MSDSPARSPGDPSRPAPDPAAPDAPGVIEIDGLRLPLDPRIVTRRIEKALRKGRYEKGERRALAALLRPGDRVLELGGGLGLVSAMAALQDGVERVVVVEANPDLLPVIARTHRLNGVATAEIVHGAVAPGRGEAEAARPGAGTSGGDGSWPQGPGAADPHAIAPSPQGPEGLQGPEGSEGLGVAAPGGAYGAPVQVAAPAPNGAPTIPFYLRRDFWASSMEPDSRPWERTAQVPLLPLGALLARHRPTVLACDVEGAELGLFDRLDLSGLRAVVLELHPKVYGPDAAQRIMRSLDDAGLRLQPVRRATSVRVFLRPDPPPAAARASTAAADPCARPGPPGRPRTAIVTCIKDEGPFILEWIAWHRAIGVDEIAVFTNHCTDGTDHLLDRLEAMGLCRRLPNPALAFRQRNYQPAALALAPHLPEVQRADYVISMDVDEFINVRLGDGSLAALYAETGPFDALSISELTHGSNGRLRFVPGLVTAQFPGHESESPGARRAMRGVKTLVRTGPKLARLRNHRPDFRGLPGDVRWLDGSGRPLAALLEDPEVNGVDVRGTYGLVSLEHYPLRALDSYLVKMDRGDVVVGGRMVSQRYWRLRNRFEARSSDLSRQQPAFRAALARLMADGRLAALHAACCAAHAARIREIAPRSPFRERRDWILENAWTDAPPG
ncbi:glycosyltransferase family 2 protein [Rhodovulum sp. DZ06]|uniref:glycosyltransferase family 2 protein n=1 Tax=Rhodovulum sp. DZ06 TaxID=3425126 RepID=UPI003D333701